MLGVFPVRSRAGFLEADSTRLVSSESLWNPLQARGRSTGEAPLIGYWARDAFNNEESAGSLGWMHKTPGSTAFLDYEQAVGSSRLTKFGNLCEFVQKRDFLDPH